MNLKCEYIFKVKIDNLSIPASCSEKEIKENIMSKGRKMMIDHFNNIFFDPEKKIFFEHTNYELNIEEHESSTSH